MFINHLDNNLIKFEEEMWILLFFGGLFLGLHRFFYIMIISTKKNGDRTNPKNTEDQKYMVSFQIKFPN